MKFGWIFTPFFCGMIFFSHVCAVQRLPAVKESFVWIGLNQKIWKWSPESGSNSELCADQCELRMACMPFLTLLLMQLFMRTLSKVYKMRALGTVSEMITTVPETCYQEGCIWSVALNDEKWWIDFCTLVHQSSGKRKGPVSRIPPSAGGALQPKALWLQLVPDHVSSVWWEETGRSDTERPFFPRRPHGNQSKWQSVVWFFF